MATVLREHVTGGAAKGLRLAALIGAGDTSATVSTAGGLATWPSGSTGRVPIVFARGLATEEHAYYTGKSGDTLTGLVRGVDGTIALQHAANTTVEHGLHASHADVANELASLPTAAGQLLIATAADTWAASKAIDVNDGTLIVPTATVPAQTADGSMVWDSDGNVLTVGTGTGRRTMVDTDTAQTLTNKSLTISQVTDLASAWASFTPTWTATVTNPVIGDGTLAGRYKQVGKMVFFQIAMTAGSTTTFGSGTYAFALPVDFLATAGTPQATAVLPVAQVRCATSAANVVGYGFLASGPIIRASLWQSGTTDLNGAPLTAVTVAWTTGDVITIAGCYEAV